jgi:flagellar hook-associated protein 3 FlgL
MRVTTSMMVGSTLRDLNRSLGRLQTSQRQLATGKRLNQASDDPTAATGAMQIRKQLNLAAQRSRALDDARGWLQTADSALTSGLDMLSRAKQIAVEAANTGATIDPGRRAALATELRSLRDDLIGVANTTYGTRSVFAGSAAGPAYSPAGAFVGNSAIVVRDVAAGTAMAISSPGPQVFGVPGGSVGDMFEVLDRLATAVATGNDAAIATEHANLDAATSTMSAAAADIGTRSARLDTIEAHALSGAEQLEQQLSAIVDADPASTIVTEKAQENAYQAALMAAARILPPSLLDYLH